MWFRRDLRLADNPALLAAGADGAEVVPVFVVDPRFSQPSPEAVTRAASDAFVMVSRPSLPLPEAS